MAAAPSSWPSGWATLTVIAAAASLTRVSSNCTAPHVWNGAVNGEIASTTSHTAQSLNTTPLTISASIAKDKASGSLTRSCRRE
jgi:hypothetical protein